MFSRILLAVSMACLAATAPTTRATAPKHFTLLALHYGSPVHEQPVAFYGNRWVLDLPTIAPCEASNCTACKFPTLVLSAYDFNTFKTKTHLQQPHS